MRSAGVIVEYNPFHNGHLHHLKETKKIRDADIVIAAMSGNFLQRGEPALVSKWSRTSMALQSGIDIVVEIPYAFAVQKAEIFGFGAIQLLSALQCEYVCFGSESGNIEEFYHTVHLIQNNLHEYNKTIRKSMRKGISYPQALARAYSSLHKDEATVDLTKPNNILGFYYTLAASQLHDPIDLLTIERKNAHHHDQTFTDETIASATSIRNSLFNHYRLDDISPYIPAATQTELDKYYRSFGQFHRWENYWPYLQYKLLTADPVSLSHIYDIDEGLHNRLQRYASQSNKFKTFMELIKTKRYTWTRLQRICTHILMNVTKEEMSSKCAAPQYIRLLGMSRKGRAYLNKIKKDVPLPIVSTISAFPDDLLSLDIKSSQVYSLGLPEPFRQKLLAKEFNQPPVIFND